MFDFFKKKKNEKEKLEREIALLKSQYEGLEKQYTQEKAKVEQLTESINNLELKENHLKKVVNKKSLEYVDQLEGLEFEEYTKELLKKLGYKKVEVTKSSGDFGIDILAEKDFVSYAIQCKLYSSPLGNDSVQEAYSGKEYYGRDLAVVITNSTFTPAAKELAKKTNVLLWDREILEKMLKQVNGDFSTTLASSSTECKDPLYDEIVEFAIETGKVSASLLQRRFRLGYNRACRIVDTMEEEGIVGPQNGSSPREVLIDHYE